MKPSATSLSVCQPINPSICRSIYLSVCLPIYPSIYLSIWKESAHLSIYNNLPIYLPTYLPTEIPISRSISLSPSIYIYVSLSLCQVPIHLSTCLFRYLPTYLHACMQTIRHTNTLFIYIISTSIVVSIPFSGGMASPASISAGVCVQVLHMCICMYICAYAYV